MFQCAAECCSVLQRVAEYCKAWQSVAEWCSVLRDLEAQKLDLL